MPRCRPQAAYFPTRPPYCLNPKPRFILRFRGREGFLSCTLVFNAVAVPAAKTNGTAGFSIRDVLTNAFHLLTAAKDLAAAQLLSDPVLDFVRPEQISQLRCDLAAETKQHATGRPRTASPASRARALLLARCVLRGQGEKRGKRAIPRGI